MNIHGCTKCDTGHKYLHLQWKTMLKTKKNWKKKLKKNTQQLQKTWKYRKINKCEILATKSEWKLFKIAEQNKLNAKFRTTALQILYLKSHVFRSNFSSTFSLFFLGLLRENAAHWKLFDSYKKYIFILLFSVYFHLLSIFTPKHLLWK